METSGVTTLETKTVDKLIAGSHPPVMMPVTIVKSGKLTRGTVLGRITASGKLTAYKATNNDGSETARVILARDVDATDADQVALVYVHGEFNSAALTGSDAAGANKLQEFGIYIKEVK